MKKTRDLPGLLDLARDWDKEVRRQAMAALREIGDPSVKDYYLLALMDPDEDVRYEAVQALAPLADEWMLPALINCLVEPCWRVRKTAAEILLRLCQSPTVSAGAKHKIRNLKRLITHPHYSDSMPKRIRDKDGKKKVILVPDDFGIGLEWPEEADQD